VFRIAFALMFLPCCIECREV